MKTCRAASLGLQNHGDESGTSRPPADAATTASPAANSPTHRNELGSAGDSAANINSSSSSTESDDSSDESDNEEQAPILNYARALKAPVQQQKRQVHHQHLRSAYVVNGRNDSGDDTWTTHQQRNTEQRRNTKKKGGAPQDRGGRSHNPDSRQNGNRASGNSGNSARVITGTGSGALKSSARLSQTKKNPTGLFVTRLPADTRTGSVRSHIQSVSGLSVRVRELKTRYDTYASFYVEADAGIQKKTATC